MSYIDSSLGRDEALRYRAHFSWLNYAAAWGGLILFLAAGVALYLRDFHWLAALAAVAGLAAFLSIMGPIWATEIGVTNQRLIYKRGLVARATKEVELRCIEVVDLEQSLLGRLLDYGRVGVHGTGVADIVLPLIADPLGLRRALQDGIASTQSRATTP